MDIEFDYVLVGAGLTNALVTLALASRRPDARVALVERAARPLGNHTWCFHVDDVPAQARAFVSDAIEVSWPGYEVRFPAFTRTLEHAYAAVTVPSLSAALDRASNSLRLQTFYGRAARRLSAHAVVLEDGTSITGTVVIDARGPDALTDLQVAGYQKFVGLELSLRNFPAPTPRVMDASVEQHDGFRFMYALPLSEQRVLLEDTYYSHSAELDVAELERRILRYAEENGAQVQGIVRREAGVLPLARRLSFAEPSPDEPIQAGYRAGLFHPVTGYSFPLAVRFAAALASVPAEEARHAVALRQVREQARSQARFLGFLNHLLFRGMSDADRRNVLERFYRLPEDTIRRFYALTLTPRDRARIVCGRPPRGFSFVDAFSAREARSP